jgi:hypothetical protein
MKPIPVDDMPEKAQSLLDAVLEGVDDRTKLKVHKVIEQAQVEPNDPMFLALAVLTEAKISIAPVPGDVRLLTEEMKAHLVTLQSLSRGQIQDCRDVASDIKVTASRLSRQLVRHTSGGISPVFSFLWAFFGAVCGGVLILLLQRYV